jgi:soluble cytochrome b562
MFRISNLGRSFVIIVALLATSLGFIFAHSAHAEDEKVKKTELHKKMEVIDDGMKKLRLTLRKTDQNPASIKTCDEIIEAAVACRDMVPSKAAKLSEAEQKKVVEEYKASMTKLIDTMGEMKKALVAGDNETAKKLHKSLKDQEETGHDKFIEDDKDKDMKKDKDSK